MYERLETRDYLVEALVDFETYKKLYPKLKFTPLGARVFQLQVPEGAEEEFKAFNQEIKSVYTPLLFGLNAIEAVEKSNIAIFHNYPFGELRGTGVLIGFVDTGIQYTNQLFKYENNTTRITRIWDQSIPGAGVFGFDYGTEYTQEQINEALKSEKPLTVVPSTDENGHGTFLAGVAAGNDREDPDGYVGGAPDAQLVVVKLRQASQYLRDYYFIEKDVPAYQEDDYLAGIYYLLQVARRENKPMVICTAIGSNQGGHDGDTIAERYLEEASVYEDFIFVLSAGNEANQAHHYAGSVTEKGEVSFEVNVQPGEPGFVMNIWSFAPDKLTLSVTSPLGRNTGKIPSNLVGEQKYSFPLETTELGVTYNSPTLGSGDEMIEVRLSSPTQGLWRFTLYGEKVIIGAFNVWLPRQGFILPDTRFLQPQAFITITTPSNVRSCIIVGAYNSVDQSLYTASSRGPTREQMILPTLVAPGVNVLGPSLSGGYTTGTGTGIATAVTASACALLLEWAVVKKNLDRMNTKVAKTILIRGAKQSPNVQYPNNLEGYGKLDFQNSLVLV